ncbi:MAG: NarK/NasA family nitrate transporter [Deltaproteobacteria bacterium]|nr:NarK/NasA family nitrate transporter [Deltaproteobacteria bacterium]
MAKITKWTPEDPQFWKESASGLAWRTCAVTTFSLIFSFATWFVMSAVVVRLPNIGFKFTTGELFWLAAMPGLASGILRLIHSFFIPVWGTRPVVSVATIIKLIPMVWLGYAVQDLNTTFGTFMIIGFLSGMGGGDFSSYMPSTSIFFPKRLQGVAMGIQAGIGNFGVSVVQFVTPWIIGGAMLGAIVGGPQIFTKGEVIKGAITVTKVAEDPTAVGVDCKVKGAKCVVADVVVNNPELVAAIVVTKDGGVVKDVVAQDTDTVKVIKADVVKDASGVIIEVKKTEGILVGGTAPFTPVGKNAAGTVTDVVVKKVVKKAMWVQNAAFWYVPFLILAFILCLIFLRSLALPGKGFKGQFEILSTKNRALTHQWNCTVTYITSFGSFSGYAAAFPLMIKVIYGGFDGAPDPLAYAFYGPLIGGLSRAVTGPIFDKWGGSKGMFWTFLGLIIGCLVLIFGGFLTPTGLDKFQGFFFVMLWIFLMTGIANAATFRQYPIVFGYSPAKGAQILGWTGAWAAFGPFIFASLIGMSIEKTGSAVTFFIGASIFYAYAFILNWYYYTRKGAERFDYGNSGGTWWDKAKDSWTGGQ